MNRVSRLFRLLGDMPHSYRLGIAWGYCFLLIYLLITPSPLAPFGDWGIGTEEALDRTLSSYVEHVLAYSGLVVVFWWSGHPETARPFWLLIGAASAHAIVFEGIQYFVPQRYCDWQDLFCNLAGVALGTGMINAMMYWGDSCPYSASPIVRNPQL
jgi:VanZ family protein